ncbi:glycosyl hydrolases family 31-domain-containing protein [Chlamydoabsidia padenii]|nr:glycosyl hydrolases family 31-domain-containing protein [Chlamydoabsidia padenii]
MWANALKAVGLAPVEDYIQPRLSIGNRVLDNEFSTGHFKIHVDSQQLMLSIKNSEGRVIWQSIHNEPFLSSTVGTDDYGMATITTDGSTEPTISAGVFTPVVEHDTLATRLQTITRIAYDETESNVVNVFGGLSPKLVLPTHLDYKLSFKEISPKQLELFIKVLKCDRSMEKYQRLILTGLSRKEESFYGFGEQFCSIDHKGQKVPILIRERGKGRTASSGVTLWSSTFNILTGDNLSSNCVAPFYMTSDNRGFYLTNTEYSSFDLQHPDRVVVRVNSTSLTARLIDGSSLLDLLTEYTSYTGRVRSLPNWVGQGAITEIQGGQEKVRQIVQRLQFYQVPLAAVCISDWTGNRPLSTSPQQEHQRRRSSSSGRDVTTTMPILYNLKHNSHSYPDWLDLIQELTQRAISAKNTAITLPIRVLVNISPFLSNTDDPSTSSLFNRAKEEGYLVKSTDHQNLAMISTQPGNTVGMIDLTNPDARQWLKCILKKQVFDNGISGYTADYGNTLSMDPTKVRLFSNQDPAAYHNQYAEDWAELHMELFKEFDLDDNDAVCFVRSGFTRSPGKIQVLTTGDHNVTWGPHDGIKSAVTTMVTAGLSGFSVSHCDIGGYITSDGGYPGTRMTRNRELLFRWMELAAFTPVFRTSEGLIPEVNAQFYDNEESYTHLAHTAKLFVSLEPYRKQLLKEAQIKGWPLIRHLILYYPQDDKVKQMTWQQFLLGSALMVAPTLSPASFVKVYFPKDDRNITWRHIWTSKIYDADGSYQAVDTPLGQPAAFVMEPRDGQTGSDYLYPLIKFASSYYESLNNNKD